MVFFSFLLDHTHLLMMTTEILWELLCFFEINSSPKHNMWILCWVILMLVSSFLKHKLYAYNFSALAVCNILKFLWLWIIFCYCFSSSLYNFPHITLFNPTLAILNFRFFSPFYPQHPWHRMNFLQALWRTLLSSERLLWTARYWLLSKIGFKFIFAAFMFSLISHSSGFSCSLFWAATSSLTCSLWFLNHLCWS